MELNQNAKYKAWWWWFRKELKCEICGEDRHYCLDFHHKDPSTKTMQISEMVHRKFKKQKVIDEIKKCQVLCKNCHAETHWIKSGLEEKYMTKEIKERYYDRYAYLSRTLQD